MLLLSHAYNILDESRIILYPQTILKTCIYLNFYSSVVSCVKCGMHMMPHVRH